MPTAVPTLKRIRKQKGYTSGRTLANKLNVSHEAVYSWERGDYYPLFEHRMKLELLLGVPVAELFAPDTTTAAS
jgi:transcriptional regulator with XRE-family HTH domain